MGGLLYKPFGIIAGMIGARAGRALFERLWANVDAYRPPSPRRESADWRKAIGGAALEAASYAAAKAAADRLAARSFHHLTGIWPEKAPQDPEAERLAAAPRAPLTP